MTTEERESSRQAPNSTQGISSTKKDYFDDLRIKAETTFVKRERTLTWTAWIGGGVLLLLLGLMTWLMIVTLTYDEGVTFWAPPFVDKTKLGNVAKNLLDKNAITPMITSIGVLVAALLTFTMSVNTQRQKNQNEHHVSLASLNTAERARCINSIDAVHERYTLIPGAIRSIQEVAQKTSELSREHKQLGEDFQALFEIVIVADPNAAVLVENVAKYTAQFKESAELIEHLLPGSRSNEQKISEIQSEVEGLIEDYSEVLLESEEASVRARFGLPPRKTEAKPTLAGTDLSVNN